MTWDEGDYRRKVQQTLARIEKAFSDVDPDVAECEISLGAMTVTLSDQSRFILEHAAVCPTDLAGTCSKRNGLPFQLRFKVGSMVG